MVRRECSSICSASWIANEFSVGRGRNRIGIDVNNNLPASIESATSFSCVAVVADFERQMLGDQIIVFEQ